MDAHAPPPSAAGERHRRKSEGRPLLLLGFYGRALRDGRRLLRDRWKRCTRGIFLHCLAGGCPTTLAAPNPNLAHSLQYILAADSRRLQWCSPPSEPGGDVGGIEDLPPELLASALEDEPMIEGRGGFVLEGTVAPAVERWAV